ncbi:MAG: hydroxyethylthiazole kinase [Alphaproteobacteria bacterium]
MTHAEKTASLLKQLRAATPLVQNITNFVAMDFAANALLAIGASPAMVHTKEEVADFVQISSALTINIGTLSPLWVEGMERAITAAQHGAKPWVFDPVGVGATPYRTAVARQLADMKPTVLRGNASEIMTLAGVAGIASKGVDSTRGSNEAEAPAKEFAARLGSTIVVTGPIDIVTDGQRVLRIGNGHEMMPRITALGCGLTGLIGAFLAVEKDAVIAATAATAIFGLAGEIAAAKAEGPGSLRVHLLDALYKLDEATVAARVKISAA